MFKSTIKYPVKYFLTDKINTKERRLTVHIFNLNHCCSLPKSFSFLVREGKTLWMKKRETTQEQKQMFLISSFWIKCLLPCFVYLIQKSLRYQRKSLQLIFILKRVACSLCCKFWAGCENVVFKSSSDSASTTKYIFYIANWRWKCQWWKKKSKRKQQKIQEFWESFQVQNVKMTVSCNFPLFSQYWW